MRNKRSVDDIPLDELERIVAIRRREARQERLRYLDHQGRRLASPMDVASEVPLEPEPAPLPQQHEAAEDLQPVTPPVTYDITDDIPRFEDEIGWEQDQPRRRRKPRRADTLPAGAGPYVLRRRAVWDRLLLIVEVLAVVGIVCLLIVAGYFVLDESGRIEALEQKSADIQREADAMRATPTPQAELRIHLADYVLPGGHTYNDGIGTFNIEELPESIRRVAIDQINNAPQADLVERPVFAPERIEIPAISVSANIYGGDDWFQLQKGVGHYQGSANPGERGNMVLSAHNDIYGEIFRDLQLLEPGDQVRVMARNNRWYTYVVESKQIVDPTDVWVLDQGNDFMATLITCYPYRVDNRRMVVIVRLVGSDT
jgi:sortase A